MTSFIAGIALLVTLGISAAMAADSPPSATAPSARFLMITDLEGCAGVNHWIQTREPGPAQDQARELLTDEVNATVSGIFDAEPTAIIDVWDGHGPGGLVKDKVHPKARYLREERPRKTLTPGSYTAIFFVGQHAMAGTALAPLAHTYSSRKIAYYRLNGYFVGEFGALTLLAGSRGIPVIFISGDNKTVLEARSWVPQITGVAVKQGQGVEAAKHLSHDEACRQLRQRAAEACRNRAAIQPVSLPPPYRLEIRYYDPIPAGAEQPGRKQIDSRTVELEATDLAELPI